MPPEVIHLGEKFAAFSDHWNPRIVGDYNGNEMRVVKFKGTFTWHSHAESDELFIPVSGTMKMEFRDGMRELAPGDVLLVPRGTEHRSVAEQECSALVFIHEGEPNTGAQPSAYTRPKLDRI
jgi:mannose-6-phosphate isomerase-like protein (cupin superfamily)